ncbi:MAG: MurR/RpiR family transcriptional regulator [Candidatus Eiseniibacteriota bacterium]|jgi:DNA-binding MurR/RpiR family transcriptional regulator
MFDGGVPQSGCLARIRARLSSLREAERKVARHVLASPERLLGQTVSDVAAASGVSEATVVRFARSVGYSGYQELKIAVARDQIEPLQALHEDIQLSDDAGTVARKVIGSDIQTLKDTMSVLAPETLTEAAALLAAARHILVVGVGTSSPIVLTAYHRLFRLGLSVSCESDGHLQVMRAALLGPEDVVLVISHSGSTKDPIETVRVARRAGSRVIAITQGARSPLAHEADVVLTTSSRETRFRSEALASRIAQVSIVDTLFVLLGLHAPRRTVEALRRVEDAIVVKQI